MELWLRQTTTQKHHGQNGRGWDGLSRDPVEVRLALEDHDANASLEGTIDLEEEALVWIMMMQSKRITDDSWQFREGGLPSFGWFDRRGLGKLLAAILVPGLETANIASSREQCCLFLVERFAARCVLRHCCTQEAGAAQPRLQAVEVRWILEPAKYFRTLLRYCRSKRVHVKTEQS